MAAALMPTEYFLIDLTRFGLSEKDVTDVEAEVIKVSWKYLGINLVLRVLVWGVLCCAIFLTCPSKVAAQPTEAPTYNGRTIDGCIRSFLFPESRQLQCVHDAQRIIADHYCRTIGRNSAANFETRVFDSFQRSYKLSIERSSDRLLEIIWIPDDTSSFIFVRINCD